MVIESGIQYRSFASQNEFAFFFDCVNSNVNGYSEIGFSGNSGILPCFTFQSGNIFDINNKNVWSYNPRDIINFSGNIGINYINYFINGSPICLFSPKVTDYYYDHFYVKTSNNSIDYNFFIQGSIPDHQFIFPDTVTFGKEITGSIINNDSIPKSFKIFSGDLFANNLDYRIKSLPIFVISGNQSGNIVLRPNFGNDIIQPSSNLGTIQLLLNTNFGNTSYIKDLNIIPAPIYYLELVTGYTGPTGLIDNFTYGKFYNYELRTILPENEEVHIFLRNISGHTGQIIYENFETSGNVGGNIGGFIYGSDYITGLSTGFFSGFRSRNYYGNYTTGIETALVRNFAYATGLINYYYNLPLFGASGTGASPIGTQIIGSGFKSGASIENIFVFKNTTYPVNVRLTGLYNNSLNVTNAVVNVPVYFTGNINLNYLDYFWEGSGSGIGFTGYSNKIYGITGNQIFTINGDPFNQNTLGYINYNNFITGDQKTGLLLESVIKTGVNTFLNNGESFARSFLGLENGGKSRNAFTGDNYFYITGNSGVIGFNFSNYPSSDKKILKYYSFNLDYSTKFYPYIFNLEYSLDNNTWVIADSKTSYNFYKSNPTIIEIPNSIPSNYNYIRLNIISGKVWPNHYNLNNLPESIGIKNFEIYDKKDIFILSSDTIIYNLVPNLCGYLSSDLCSSS